MRDENAKLRADNKALLDALKLTVWRSRKDFPDDPYCFLCGAGKNWATVHGHEPTCLLFKHSEPQ